MVLLKEKRPTGRVVVMLTVADGGCVVVRSREEWGELMHAVPDGARYAVIDAPSGEVITIRNVGGLKVVVEGDSTVYSNGVDLRVRGCARAYVSGRAFVMALGNARVCGLPAMFVLRRMMRCACGRMARVWWTLTRWRMWWLEAT